MADFPALDERWIGYKNKCLLNNAAFKKNYKSITSISEATVGSTGPHLFSEIGKQKYETLIKNSKYHVWSGDCHNYCLVIKGGLDLVVEEGLSSYDILPLIPILKSKDITVTDWKSKNIKKNLSRRIWDYKTCWLLYDWSKMKKIIILIPVFNDWESLKRLIKEINEKTFR